MSNKFSICGFKLHLCTKLTYSAYPLTTEILSKDLQAGAEDEQDYKAPEKGNLLYKIYSLQDLLLMVRSSVSLTHSRKVVSSQSNKVYLLGNSHPTEFHYLNFGY